MTGHVIFNGLHSQNSIEHASHMITDWGDSESYEPPMRSSLVTHPPQAGSSEGPNTAAAHLTVRSETLYLNIKSPPASGHKQMNDSVI